MPTYVYRREDGSTFEIQQRITEQPLTHDPETGQKVERVIAGTAGLIFKGSGFYLTDYARKGSGNTDNGSSKSTDTAEKATSGTSETKPAAKTETKTSSSE